MRIFFGKWGRRSRYYKRHGYSPCYAHHRFVATYLSILLPDNGHYFRNLFETRLPQQAVASFIGQGPAQWFSNFFEPWAPS